MNHLEVPVLSLPRPPGFGWAAALFERASGLGELDRLYRRRPPAMTPPVFLHYALRELRLGYRLASGRLDAVPRQGPLIVIANHPAGAGDGLVLADLLLRQRPDLLLLANRLLLRVPELAPLIAPVEVFRAGASGSGLRQVLRHLGQGGALLVFPAGEVSRLDWRGRCVSDPPWAATVAQLACRSGASVLPIHIEGRAGLPSLLAGALHPRLRTACLPRDLLNQRGAEIGLHLGEPIAAAELAGLVVPGGSARRHAQAQTAYLRLVTESLGARSRPPPPLPPPEPLAAPVDPAVLAAEIAGLPTACGLRSEGEFHVYCAGAEQIPQLLLEIGRLRELSFRGVQEGSGRARDLDRYDRHYQHLFLWHRGRREVLGAYRLGDCERILAAHGVAGLYSHSLFDYDAGLLACTGPALELGRSFVRPEWQRSFRSLRLLWSGIAALLDARPQLQCLFGPVSISASYSAAGRALMAAALSAHHGDPVLRVRVRPRTPAAVPRGEERSRPVVAALADPARLSRVIARLERGSGLPVLLRHYLELNGRFAGFNVDADFGNTLDGLVFVRVADIPARLRAKFAGVAGA